MRRNDREIKNFDEIVEVMQNCDVCRIALFDEDYPYIVPMNYGMQVFESGKIELYFHCASEGKKLDLIRKNNNVCFEMDCQHQLRTDDVKMSCTMSYKSVIGRGKIFFINDKQEKFEALLQIMKHYHKENFDFNRAVVPQTTVFKICVDEIKGKNRK